MDLPSYFPSGLLGGMRGVREMREGRLERTCTFRDVGGDYSGDLFVIGNEKPLAMRGARGYR